MPVQLNEVSAWALGQLGDLLGPPPCLPVAAALENQGPGQEQRWTTILALHASGLAQKPSSFSCLLFPTSFLSPYLISQGQGIHLPYSQLGVWHLVLCQPLKVVVCFFFWGGDRGEGVSYAAWHVES